MAQIMRRSDALPLEVGLTNPKRRLRRGDFTPVVNLPAATNRILAENNDNRQPCTWVADSERVATPGEGRTRQCRSTRQPVGLPTQSGPRTQELLTKPSVVMASTTGYPVVEMTARCDRSSENFTDCPTSGSLARNYQLAKFSSQPRRGEALDVGDRKPSESTIEAGLVHQEAVSGRRTWIALSKWRFQAPTVACINRSREWSASDAVYCPAWPLPLCTAGGKPRPLPVRVTGKKLPTDAAAI
jgi:hypothetical protein